MRVLVLCLSNGYGGLELYAAQEVKQLRNKGHHCLAVVAQDSMLDKHLQEAGIETLHLKVSNRRLPLLAARQLASLMDEQQIDLVHIHWNDDLNLAVLAKKFAQRNIKLIYSRHMAITRSKKDPLHRWFYREVDRLIVVTKLMQQEANTHLPLPPSRISQLYLGVAEVDNAPADDQQCFDDSFPRREMNIALFGRIEPYKGQHLLIDAVSKLISKGLDISTTIVGHVMDENYFLELQQNVESAGLASYIKFESFVKNPAQRMKCYDAIVLTTYSETFGLVLIEAMRAGVMVMGTNAGGVREIIDDKKTGLLFEPGDVQQLADRIESVYQDRNLLNELAENGRNKADDIFSDTRHFAGLESILEQTVAHD